MDMYKLQGRDIPCNDKFDVIVIGGGPSGCSAASAAGREGARTLLVEATGALGGMGTNGLVPSWCPFSDGEKIIYGGIAQAVFERTKAGMPHIRSEQLDWVPIDPELLKSIYDDLMADSGVKVLFNSFFVSVDVEDGVVKALIVANKSGLTAYRANVYIDGTGDADVAAWSGAEFFKGDEKSGELMPVTHCFTLVNVDDDVIDYGAGFGSDCPGTWRYEMLHSGKYPLLGDGHLVTAQQGPGVYGFNAGHMWDVDNTEPETVSNALAKGRKTAMEFRNALAEFHPAFKNAFLVNTGPLLGIRETRRIVGDYVLTFDDYIERRTFSDEICRNSYPIDIHAAKDEIEQTMQGGFHVMDRFDNYKSGESHGIPYRCLTPKGIKNVLVSGRAISCDRLVQGSVRVMPPCLCMGEAAGIAAFMALDKCNDVHAVDTKVLREKLCNYGAYLPKQ